MKSRMLLLALPALVIGLAACEPRPQVTEGTETPAKKKDEGFVYREYIDAVYNQRNPDAIDRYFTSGVVVHALSPGVEGGNGTQYLKDLAHALLDAFPDLKISVDEVVREGDHLAARVTLQGTQKGEFAGIKPTGKTIQAANFATYRLEGNKIAEVWSLVDMASIRRQLSEK